MQYDCSTSTAVVMFSLTLSLSLSLSPPPSLCLSLSLSHTYTGTVFSIYIFLKSSIHTIAIQVSLSFIHNLCVHDGLNDLSLPLSISLSLSHAHTHTHSYTLEFFRSTCSVSQVYNPGKFSSLPLSVTSPSLHLCTQVLSLPLSHTNTNTHTHTHHQCF